MLKQSSASIWISTSVLFITLMFSHSCLSWAVYIVQCDIVVLPWKLRGWTMSMYKHSTGICSAGNSDRAMPELALSCMGNIPILVWQTCECCLLIVTYTYFWLGFALRLDRSKNLYPVVIGPRWRISRRRKTSGTVCLWRSRRTAADISSDGKSGR